MEHEGSIAKFSKDPDAFARMVANLRDHSHKLEQVLKLPHLGNLCHLLSEVSLCLSLHQYDCKNTISIDIWNKGSLISIKFIDILSLSDLLYEEMCRRLEQLFHALGLLPTTVSPDLNQHYPNISSISESVLLLRCCVVILPLLEFNQSLVLEKSRILVAALGKLCGPDLVSLVASCKTGEHISTMTSYFTSFISKECVVGDDGVFSSQLEVDAKISYTFQEASGSLVHRLCSLLEVFADEILLHQDLRKYLMAADSELDFGSEMFVHNATSEDVHGVLEVISAHFLLSICNEAAMNKFIHTIFWSDEWDFKSHGLSHWAVMTLLDLMINISSPDVFQAHVFTLITRSLGVHFIDVGLKVEELNDSYIKLFDLSIQLYMRHISDVYPSYPFFPVNSNSGSSGERSRRKPGRNCREPLQSFIRTFINRQINSQILKFVGFCQKSLSNELSRTSSDMMLACTEYITKNEHVLDESHRDEICSILKCVVFRSLSGPNRVNAQSRVKGRSYHKACLLAAILNAMGCSLLQIIRLIRGSRSLGILKTLKDYPICREFETIAGIISLFGNYKVRQPIERILYDVMGRYPERHKSTKIMFIHFVGVLSFCFEKGPEILWKRCIFMLMILLNLMVFEEGNIDALKPLLESLKDYLFSLTSQNKISQNIVPRESSLIIASNLQKIQMQHLGERCKYLTYGTKNCVGAKAVDVRNGEAFLKCITNKRELDRNKICDYDDLNDFIVCKPGKDYSSWLKHRKRYREWRCSRYAIARNERKRKLWRLLTGGFRS
ncbi:hypothetical protein AMTRI_Chr12g275570 [Amborella trichopoda]|uniref:uncharacterized protein LOC18446851 isoform X1 n=1 Tax=Amborella trichopoda TaxID=13333 RepID=UPI0005D369C5|nr:uncharacterized protein LOC18446851 isoform X1 [Amborella trichopoda]|eukprot:XP_011628005.1 uncharacterized protein LOC18446851 isoform X1 [Amborella trichopoda]